MKKINKKIVGVIGGMGPQASHEFYGMLIDKSIRNYGVVNNDEFPEILIDSLPVPDFIENTVKLKQAKSIIIERIKRFNRYPVDLVCMACNTGHILIEDMRAVSNIPVISIIEEVTKESLNNGFKKVGLLATPITYKSGIYEGVNSERVRLIKPIYKEQKRIEKIIREVIGGGDKEDLKQRFYPIIKKFIDNGKLDAVILGCTELPLIIPNNLNIPIINSLDVLADSILKIYFS